jgi:mannosylglucosylglycerate synthase
MANTDRTLQSHRIGFVSTRFESTDGVSLETEKWAHVLQGLGQECFYFAGLCNRPQECSYVVEEAHFKHPEIVELHEQIFSRERRPLELTRQIYALKEHLKDHLYRFIRKFGIELLVVENALAIPLNIPLGMALTELIAETGMKTIAHHHDFYWERKRFLVNCAWAYINMSFPPHLPTIQHVVINSAAANQLGLRTGISATIIPNVMDFDTPPLPPDDYTADLRANLGIAADEYFLLQPTRVVRRKGIERAIELVKRLNLKARLVISHNSGDEGNDYEKRVREFAEMLDVPTNFVGDVIQDQRGTTKDGRKVYSLWDVYPFADLVTYPSLLEGFGNAYLEAIYYRKPILVNNYTIYALDIRPKGFRTIEFDGYITDRTVQQVREILLKPELAKDMTEHNYQLAKRFFSFSVLERQLRILLQACFGEEK